VPLEDVPAVYNYRQKAFRSDTLSSVKTRGNDRELLITWFDMSF